ncbi:hypothetical protein CEXT_291071 [Caerostris extrusa]|uniref:Uncharacterized protein n=1 Tax=Caerostris extrusa TaxID=172846 RepID=A0AAV4NUC8_CAEEX|nr:hypothetical protein CEXT_291071 [Caerostris extrusa]
MGDTSRSRDPGFRVRDHVIRRIGCVFIVRDGQLTLMIFRRERIGGLLRRNQCWSTTFMNTFKKTKLAACKRGIDTK